MSSVQQTIANFLYKNTPLGGYVSSLSSPQITPVYVDKESRLTYMLVTCGAVVTHPPGTTVLPEAVEAHLRKADQHGASVDVRA